MAAVLSGLTVLPGESAWAEEWPAYPQSEEERLERYHWLIRWAEYYVRSGEEEKAREHLREWYRLFNHPADDGFFAEHAREFVDTVYRFMIEDNPAVPAPTGRSTAELSKVSYQGMRSVGSQVRELASLG